MVVVLLKVNGECHPIAALPLKFHTKAIIGFTMNAGPELEDIPTHIRVALVRKRRERFLNRRPINQLTS
jgi:hypothetical protein